MSRTRKLVASICLLLVITLLIALDSTIGGLRFADAQADSVAGNASLWLPATSAVLLAFVPRSRLRFWSFVVLGPFAALWTLLGVVVVLFSGFMPVVVNRHDSIHLRYSTIDTYYSSAGAIDDGFIRVQQEIKLMPGLLWVQPILSTEGTDGLVVKVVDRHHVQCNYTAYKEAMPYPVPEAKHKTVWVF